MPDRLSLSLWVRDYDAETMLRHLEELLRLFPFTQLRPGVSSLKIYALEFAEPALLDHTFADLTDAETVIGLCREFENPDCAYVVEGWWDLWKRRPDGWKLAASPVTLICFGPAFDNGEGDNLRIQVGDDEDFLPRPGDPDGMRMAHSNLKSVVRLAQELEAGMPIARRSLWSESGENFAERVDEALSE
jgi:hypothetical protein